MRRRTFALVAVTAVLLSGCSANAVPDVARPSGTPQPTTQLTVYAETSLRDAFDTLASKFDIDAKPRVLVQLLYGRSQALSSQIVGGAHVDVFATPDRAAVQRLVDRGLVDAPQPFASHPAATASPTPGAATSREWIVTVDAAREPAAARRFVAYVLSAQGQAVLAQWGFGAP